MDEHNRQLDARMRRLMRNYRLFSGEATRFNQYNKFVHLYEICTFFGPFPRGFLDQARDQRVICDLFDEEGMVDHVEIGLRPENIWYGTWKVWEDHKRFMSMLRR